MSSQIHIQSKSDLVWYSLLSLHFDCSGEYEKRKVTLFSELKNPTYIGRRRRKKRSKRTKVDDNAKESVLVNEAVDNVNISDTSQKEKSSLWKKAVSRR